MKLCGHACLMQALPPMVPSMSRASMSRASKQAVRQWKLAPPSESQLFSTLWFKINMNTSLVLKLNILWCI